MRQEVGLVGLEVITNGIRFRAGRSLAFGLIWTCAALGDGPLFPGAQYTTGDAPGSVAIGDLDGDGVPDLAVANFGSDNISVLLGVGDGTFAAAVHYAAGDGPYSVAIGDLDGDQVPDLAVANSSSGFISVLLGVGDGTFAAALHSSAGTTSFSIAIGDLNGDQVSGLACVLLAPALLPVMVMTFLNAQSTPSGQSGRPLGQGFPSFAPPTHTWTVGTVIALRMASWQLSAPVTTVCAQQFGSQSVPKPRNVLGASALHASFVRSGRQSPVSRSQQAPDKHRDTQVSPPQSSLSGPPI